MDTESTPNPYDAVIADLKNKRDSIDSAITALEQLRQLNTSALSSALASPSVSNEIKFDTFFNLGIAEASKKYLGMVKKPQTTAEILEAIKKGGVETTNQSFYTIISRQSRLVGDIIKVNDRWGLPEWYGVPVKPRKRNEKGKQEDEEVKTA